ncbi:hypothetical protein EJ06DRAFT_579209 [Trichodelitschia bisporula]|uniref:Zn(2)-C6 fungal-type domain-containing protein n=1 Tax=Trichodelitschia bisporula TaxID=703511 RepID=A0A6G1I8J2_9PEZI|nr:hypothetical protein EJ06DRAFT_579209 [Trichodelitschia bisporula]
MAAAKMGPNTPATSPPFEDAGWTPRFDGHQRDSYFPDMATYDDPFTNLNLDFSMPMSSTAVPVTSSTGPVPFFPSVDTSFTSQVDRNSWSSGTSAMTFTFGPFTFTPPASSSNQLTGSYIVPYSGPQVTQTPAQIVGTFAQNWETLPAQAAAYASVITSPKPASERRFGVPSPRADAQPPVAESGPLVSKKRKRSAKDHERIVKDITGKEVGALIQWGSKNTQRKTMSDKERLSYKVNRNLGACEACRRSKKACNRSCAPFIVCLRSKVLQFKDGPADVILFRPRPWGPHPLASTHSGIYELSELGPFDYPTHTLQLTQGLGRELTTYVAPFEPGSEFKTKHVWQGAAGKRELELPPYCLTRLDSMKESVAEYIRTSWHNVYLQHIISQSDPIAREVLLRSQQYAQAHNKPTIIQALKVLAINRMIELDWVICGPETLGMPSIQDPDCPWHGKAPITPVMDTQLDQIVIQEHLVPTSRRLLTELQKKMGSGGAPSSDDWFEIFLVTFILSRNTELLLKHSRKNAQRYGAEKRYNSMELAEFYFHGTRVLLAHYHYKYTMKPLLQASSGKKGSRIGSLQHPEVEFLQKVQRLVEDRKDSLVSLRASHQYETDMYWCHQLFTEGWTPGPLDIVDVV